MGAASSGIPEVVCRNRCIDALVKDAAQRNTLEITFETDERIVSRDQRQVATTLRKIGLVDGLAYRHLPAASEALLIIPDAIGWAWMRGGDWRRRCSRVTVVNVE